MRFHDWFAKCQGSRRNTGFTEKEVTGTRSHCWSLRRRGSGLNKKTTTKDTAVGEMKKNQKLQHVHVVVIGRTPADSLTRWILGSTSEALIMRANSSVLVVPAEV